MSTTNLPATDLAAAREHNESSWRASAIALYSGDIDRMLSYWTSEPRYRVAYPVDGFPSMVEGLEQFKALFGGFASAAKDITVTDVVVHQTDNPDVVIVEERMTANLHDGGRYENELIIRVTFRDGLIHDMFEYYGQVAHQQLAVRLAAAVPA